MSRAESIIQISWDAVFNHENALTEHGQQYLENICTIHSKIAMTFSLTPFFETFGALSQERKIALFEFIDNTEHGFNLLIATALNNHEKGIAALTAVLTSLSSEDQERFLKYETPYGINLLMAAAKTGNADFFVNILTLVKNISDKEKKAKILNIRFLSSAKLIDSLPLIDSIPLKNRLIKEGYDLFLIAAESNNVDIMNVVFDLSVDDFQMENEALEKCYCAVLTLAINNSADNMISAIAAAMKKAEKKSLLLLIYDNLFAEYENETKNDAYKKNVCSEKKMKALIILTEYIFLTRKHFERIFFYHNSPKFIPLLTKMLEYNISGGVTTRSNTLFYILQEYCNCNFIEAEMIVVLNKVIEKLSGYPYESIFVAIAPADGDMTALQLAAYWELQDKQGAFSGRLPLPSQFRNFRGISSVLKLMLKLKPKDQVAIFQRYNARQYHCVKMAVYERYLAYAGNPGTYASCQIRHEAHFDNNQLKNFNVLDMLEQFHSSIVFNKGENEYSYDLNKSHGSKDVLADRKKFFDLVETKTKEACEKTDLPSFISYLDILFLWMTVDETLCDDFFDKRNKFISKAIHAVLILKDQFEEKVNSLYSPASFSTYEKFIEFVAMCSDRGWQCDLAPQLFPTFFEKADPEIILHLFSKAAQDFITLQLKNKKDPFDLLSFIKKINGSEELNSTLAQEVYTLLSKAESLPSPLIVLLAKHEKLKEAVLAHIKMLSKDRDDEITLINICKNFSSNLNKFFKVPRSIAATKTTRGVFSELMAEYNEKVVNKKTSDELLMAMKTVLNAQFCILKESLICSGKIADGNKVSTLLITINAIVNIKALEQLLGPIEEVTFKLLSDSNSDRRAKNYAAFNKAVRELDATTQDSLKEFIEKMKEYYRSFQIVVEAPLQKTHRSRFMGTAARALSAEGASEDLEMAGVLIIP